jgi:hypothetical protein
MNMLSRLKVYILFFALTNSLTVLRANDTGKPGFDRYYFIRHEKFSIVDSINSQHVIDPDSLYLKPYTFYYGYAFFEFHRHHRCWFNCDVRVQESQAYVMDRYGKFQVITTMNDSIYKASDMNRDPSISYSHLPGKWHINKRKKLLIIREFKNSNYFPNGDRTFIYHYERTGHERLIFSKKKERC